MKKMHIQENIIKAKITRFAEKSLIEEVKLTPKPGLVDRQNTGSHKDMNCILFIKSAKTLKPYFFNIVDISWGQRISPKLREDISLIGRQAELKMYETTNNVNTHKGAIWVIGLIASVISSRYSRNKTLELDDIFLDISRLAAFTDSNYENKKITHGKIVNSRYQSVYGAEIEAKNGFPHIQIALSNYYSVNISKNERQKRLHMLLIIISSLNDTCILYRSNNKILKDLQKLALEASKNAVPNKSFAILNRFCEKYSISPGGSADILAGSLFLVSLLNYFK